MNDIFVVIHNDTCKTPVIRIGPLPCVFLRRKDAERVRKKINKLWWRGYSRVERWSVFDHALNIKEIWRAQEALAKADEICKEAK